VLTVRDVAVGSLVYLETSFGVVAFTHEGRLVTALSPHRLMTLSRIMQLSVDANGTVFRISGTV
jgi:hypothetical protein